MTERVDIGGLKVARVLVELIEQEILPGTGVDADQFWTGLESILDEMVPRNRSLLAKRDELQLAIDNWHKENAGKPHDPDTYREFLVEIGYLLEEGSDFEIETRNVDDEIALVAGPHRRRRRSHQLSRASRCCPPSSEAFLWHCLRPQRPAHDHLLSLANEAPWKKSSSSSSPPPPPP